MYYGTYLVALCTCLILNLAESAQVTDVCPPDLARDQYLQVRGSSCYQFVVYREATHSSARLDCERNGGHLAVVHNQDTQTYLQERLFYTFHILVSRVWVGLNDIVNENNFVWEDGSRMDYTNWLDGEGPGMGSHDANDCVVFDMVFGGKWRVVPCETGTFLFLHPAENHHYICEFPVRAPATANPTAATTAAPVVIHIGDQVTTTSQPAVIVTSITHPCPILFCNLDCGVHGFKKDPVSGCIICECAF